ncbi:MAG TPA: DUF4386 domain-containing protein [Pyrinomonadaceae bacterium]|jgi:hypothetical protein
MEEKMNSLKRAARLAGLLWLLSVVPTGFSLMYVRPKLIVFGDAAATASNILANEPLFRMAIASNLFSSIILLFFGLTVFRLFKGVNKTLATFLLISILVTVAVGVVNSLNNLGALVVLSNADYLKAFQPEQINALMMIFLRLNNFGIGIIELFSALYLFTFGLLIIKSKYIPGISGVLLMIGASAFPINTFTKILFPQFYPAIITQLTMLFNSLGAPLTILWLLIKGAKEQQQISEV